MQNEKLHWLALKEGKTLDQKVVACMHGSSLHFNLVMSIFSPTTHILIKINLFPHRNMSHACHMISARWNFLLREWEVASNDGKWTSTRRVIVDGKENDCIIDLMRNFEDAYSITLYHFKEVNKPVAKLNRVKSALLKE